MRVTPRLIDRLLEVIEGDILPFTRQGIEGGNKLFGAAVLTKTDLDLVSVGTNDEARNPLLHGEISCLNHYWALPESTRPAPRDCLFVSTHEPCSLCLSAITWSGFDNFTYLFSYEDSRDAFAIPHDLTILAEVFRCQDGDYAATNAYWTSHHLRELIEREEVDAARRRGWSERVAALREAYGELSGAYQARKGGRGIPLD